MADDKQNRGVVKSESGRLATQQSHSPIVLGDSSLEVAGLTEPQIQELRMQLAKGMIDIHKKATELHVDVKALDLTLSTMASQTEQVSKAGDSVTMTHAHTSSLGRTEVMMGNTERAAKGKLTPSQTGEGDNTMKYVIIIAVVAIVVALIAST